MPKILLSLLFLQPLNSTQMLPKVHGKGVLKLYFGSELLKSTHGFFQSICIPYELSEEFLYARISNFYTSKWNVLLIPFFHRLFEIASCLCFCASNLINVHDLWCKDVCVERVDKQMCRNTQNWGKQHREECGF